MAYQNIVGQFIYKTPFFRAKADALAENDQYLKDNGWQDSTKGIFYQASVPTGWTQDVSVNDQGLRVVSVLGGVTGGSHAISTAIPLNHAVHSIANEPDHDHQIADHTHYLRGESSNGSTPGATINVFSDSGFLRYFTNSGSGSNFNFARNELLQNAGSLTTGNSGSHDHGGVVNSNSLTDVPLAYVDVIVGTKDTSVGYTDLTNEFNHNEKIKFNPYPTLYDNDDFNNLRLTPFGTIMVFGQASAPTGWTQNAGQNDKMLRVVSGAGGGNAGTHLLSTTITLNHNHAIAGFTLPSHTFPAHRMDLQFPLAGLGAAPSAGDKYFYNNSNVIRAVGISGPAASASRILDHTDTDGAGSTETDSVSHGHSVGNSLSDIALSYVDVIEASKDSTGHSFPFVNLSTRVQDEKLVSKQRLDDFAENDEYLKFHTIPSPSRMYFYQANAPLTWTQLATQNNTAMRIVSGAGGGSFTGQGIGSLISLAHTHTLGSYNHAHNILHSSHFHTMAEASVSSFPPGPDNGLGPVGDNFIIALQGNSGSTNTYGNRTRTAGGGVSGTTDSHQHDHGGVTGSALSDITLAHADVIYCEKEP